MLRPVAGGHASEAGVEPHSDDQLQREDEMPVLRYVRDLVVAAAALEPEAAAVAA
jgi:hypothetical protein